MSPVQSLKNGLEKLGISTYDGPLPIYKYVDIQTAFKIIKNRTLLYQWYKNFNDPLDPHLAHLDLMTHGASHIDRYDRLLPPQMIASFIKDAEDTYEYFKQEALNRLGILCLSRTFKNTLMWSHYADKHKGVCLGFANLGDNTDSNLNAFNIKYSTEVLPVTLQFPPNESSMHAVINMICTKAMVWEYEEEVRILNYIKPDYYPFNKAGLCEVYFGVNCSLNDINSMRQMLLTQGYTISKYGQMKTSKNKFELEPEYLRL